jgi:hypothetical protein
MVANEKKHHSAVCHCPSSQNSSLSEGERAKYMAREEMQRFYDSCLFDGTKMDCIA